MIDQAIILLVAVIVAAVVFVAAKPLGGGIRFGTVFKAFALVLTMLPILVMSVLIIFVIEFGASMLLLLVLHITGVLPNYIPPDYERYERIGLWGMMALALALAIFFGRDLLRYIIHVAREE
jgi:hypothetical protein